AKMPAEAARRIEAVLAQQGGTGAEGAASIDPESARELALRAARLYELPPPDRAAAERPYARVLASGPENGAARAAPPRRYRARGEGQGDDAYLAAVLERRAGLELDPQARKSRLLEAAGIHEKLGDLPSAIAALQNLRSGEEGDPDALGELARLYQGLGQ